MKLRMILAVFIILVVCLVIAPETAQGQGSAVLTFQPLDTETAALSDDGEGTTRVTVTAADESTLLTLDLIGFAAGTTIDLARTAASDFEIDVVTDDLSLTLTLESLPTGSPVVLTLASDGALEVTASDPTGERAGVGLTVTELGPRLGVTITYDPLPEEYAGRITPLYPGLLDENALGGSVTLAASELADEARVMVALTYLNDDVAGLVEADLRVLRFSNAAGRYEAVGENNRGVGEPSTGAGDFGVDVQNNVVWAVPESLGSFVAGPPDPTLPSIIIDDDNSDTTGGVAFCGPAAALWFPLAMAGLTLAAWQRKRRLGLMP